MRGSRIALVFVVYASAFAAQGPDRYPVALVATAEATRGSTTITSSIKISVDRLMLASRYQRVVDALKYGGYANFLNTLRPLPAIGTIATEKNQVDVRYAWESQVDGKRRLVLVSDRPLFFLDTRPDRDRAGYELTVVELIFDDHGGATGRIAGAARVKPSPEGVVLGEFAEVPVRLTVAAPSS